MRKIFFASTIILLFALNACDSGKQLAQTKQTAQTAYNSGDYAKALELWEVLINASKENESEKQCVVFTKAGMAANKLGQTDKAIDYLKQAAYGEFSNQDTYFTLAGIYREKDNLSLELENLEIYETRFPQGNNIEYVNKRLFELYVEIEDWDKSMSMWEKLTVEQKSENQQIENYLIVNDKLDKDDVCLQLSQQLLEKDKNNIAALSWLANYYFWKAEKRYNKEMKIYEQKKTRKKYAHLLKVIDEVTVEYKQSLKYGKRLYKLDPTPANAKLLGNTYSRLNYKDKAKYYQKLGEK